MAERKNQSDRMHPYHEVRVQDFYLLIVEKEPGTYRLYVGTDGQRYAHYDSGTFRGIREAVEAARNGFNPAPFKVFPHAPYSRTEVIERAPYAFEDLLKGKKGK